MAENRSCSHCERPIKAKGFCDKHYFRFRKYGDASIRSNANQLWDGRCKGCGSRSNVLPYARRCARCQREYRIAYRLKNLEKLRAMVRESNAKRRREIRDVVLRHYGSQCACCGEKRAIFLVIDHKHGRGNAHRRSLSRSGRRAVGTRDLCAEIVRRGFPAGFRVLCWNCNYAWSKGACPHEHERGLAAARRARSMLHRS